MPGIVRADETGNTSESQTRLDPGDQYAIEQAIATGDYSGLTHGQKIKLLEMQLEQAKKDQAAANVPQQTSSGYPAAGASGPVGSPAQLAAAAAFAQQTGVAIGVPSTGSEPDPMVLRQQGKIGKYTAGVDPRYWPGAQKSKTTTLDSYSGEYAKRLEDPAFREWMARRGAVLAGMDPNDPDFLTRGRNLWDLAGQMVAANPALRRSVTPEQWLDNQYQMAGGDALYDKVTAELSPIKTTTSTQTYTVTAAQAQSAVDQLSQMLLGRMASDAELKKARAAMQKLLTPTTTTTTTDSTDPANVQTTSRTKAGVGPAEAQDILRMRMQRSSEGMAFGAGKMFQEALSKMSL